MLLLVLLLFNNLHFLTSVSVQETNSLYSAVLQCLLKEDIDAKAYISVCKKS